MAANSTQSNTERGKNHGMEEERLVAAADGGERDRKKWAAAQAKRQETRLARETTSQPGRANRTSKRPLDQLARTTSGEDGHRLQLRSEDARAEHKDAAAVWNAG